VNLLDLCAMAVPTAPATRVPPFGITFVAPSWNDEEVSNIASDYMRLG
jgi:Asp-tRNA(Asn)/Glu-tRNA(Gln) amidotransferase A subunit family amidase